MKRTLLEALALKALPRAGWHRAGVSSPESVASHSWGVAWLTLVLLPEELDLQRALTYAVLHDLAEVRTGDITPHDGIPASTKAAREHEAMRELMAELPRGSELLQAWERYEAQNDAESRFVRQLDRLDMALQARAYADAGNTGMTEFLDSAEAFLTEPALKQLLGSLR